MFRISNPLKSDAIKSMDCHFTFFETKLVTRKSTVYCWNYKSSSNVDNTFTKLANQTQDSIHYSIIRDLEEFLLGVDLCSKAV